MKEKNVITSSYDNIIKKIKNKDSFIFYFGGSWCKNCRAVQTMIYNELDSKEIYHFDPRDNLKEPIDDFRKCNNNEQEKLYKEFIKILKYKNDKTVIVDIEGNLRDTLIPSLSVPALFAIKDGTINYSLIEEYEENNVSKEQETYYINELKILAKKI